MGERASGEGECDEGKVTRVRRVKEYTHYSYIYERV